MKYTTNTRIMLIHWHNEMEIIYIKKGKGTISLDMDMMYVEAGDIIVVIPGQLHGITQLENYSMEYENIIFSSDMLISKHSDSLESEVFIPLMSGMLSFNHLIIESGNRVNRLYCMWVFGWNHVAWNDQYYI